MRRFPFAPALVALLAWAGQGPSSPVQAAAQQSTQNGIPALIDAYFKPQVAAHTFSGAVLVTRGDRTLVMKGYGMADETHARLNGPDTAFPIASNTKAFTAAAILQLQAAGKLRVTDHLCRYIRVCPENWKAVTIGELMSMTSGMKDFNFIPDEAMTSAGRIIAYVGQQPLESSPGTTWAYNDFSYRFLGYVIQQASGETYDGYIRNHIFRLLGMRHSTFASRFSSMRNHAIGYAGTSMTKLPFAPLPLPAQLSFFDAAGGIVSTAADLRRWNHALDSPGLLPASALHTMFSVHVRTNVPVNGPPYSSAYGYGWFVDKSYNRTVVQHPGRVGAYWSYVMRFPDQHVAIVVLCNRPQAANRDVVITDLARIVITGSSG